MYGWGFGVRGLGFGRDDLSVCSTFGSLIPGLEVL